MVNCANGDGVNKGQNGHIIIFMLIKRTHLIIVVTEGPTFSKIANFTICVNIYLTKMHSSGIRTARLLTVSQHTLGGGGVIPACTGWRG